jgi:NAD(P)-dependent dehydrogenase (short-subunit alcohol dehydrogenase family)
MAVAVADIDAHAAHEAADELSDRRAPVMAIACDVSQAASVQSLADRVRSELGGAHLVFNNAGVVTFKYVQDMQEHDWRWVLGVDLLGVVHGVQWFLPQMVAHGEGHFVNTASIAGLVPAATPGIVAYTTAKFGVVAFSEALRTHLSDRNIGVSVFCPGGVRSRIMDAGRNRPERFGGPERLVRLDGPGLPQATLEPDAVAAAVLNAVRRNDAYVLTHRETRGAVIERMDALIAACGRAGAARTGTA